jgi:hypothetical protein
MPLGVNLGALVVYVLRAIGSVERDQNAGAELVKLLEVFEETRDLRGADNAFQPDMVTRKLFAPTVILGAIREQHPGNCPMLDVVGARDRNPDFEASAVRRQS